MSQDNPGILHDATNSWNGYNHQGKIALYYAVKKITELIKDGSDKKANEAVLDTWFLEVEYTEDFSIGTIGAGGKLRYQTIHQVKDRKDTTLSKYESAIQGLAVNMVRHPEIEAAYLHTTKGISDEKDKTFEESVRDMIKKTDWIDEQEVKAKAKKDPAKRQEALDWLKKVSAGLPIIWQNLQNLKKIQKYPYEMPGGKPRYYCPKEAAKDYVYKSLQDFYSKHDPHKAYKQSDDFISKSYQYALEQLNEHVVFRSIHYSDKNVRRYLPLSDLYKWLVSPEIENMDEEYYLYYIKEGYFAYLKEFCDYCESENCGTCQVTSFKERFRCMKTEELRSFAYQTNPHVPGLINIETYPKFLQGKDIESPFLTGLQDIPLKPRGLSTGNTVRYMGSDNREYMLTTIAVPEKRAKEQKIKTICTEIWKNTQKRDLECNYLISDGVNVQSLRDGAIVVGPNAMFYDETKISAQGHIRILPLDDFIDNNKEKEQG